MSVEQKGALIGLIVANLRMAAQSQNKPFDAGDTFFALAFRTDKELKNIANLAGI